MTGTPTPPPPDPDCQLCAGTGQLSPAQSRGITAAGPCLCVAAQLEDLRREIERANWKAIMKEAVLEAFHEVALEPVEEAP
jgi:hypothetical protein